MKLTEKILKSIHCPPLIIYNILNTPQLFYLSYDRIVTTDTRLFNDLKLILSKVKGHGIQKLSLMQDDTHVYSFKPKGEFCIFDKRGNLVKITGNSSKKDTFLYNGLLLTKHTHESYDYTTITKHNYLQEKLVKTTIQTGTKIKCILYEYDNYGNLIKVNHHTRGITQYTYDDYNNCIQEQNGNNVTLYTYDDNNIIATKMVNGEITLYDYNDDKLVCEITGDDVITYKYKNDVRISCCIDNVEHPYKYDMCNTECYTTKKYKQEVSRNGNNRYQYLQC